jgi:hypothetical protein
MAKRPFDLFLVATFIASVAIILVANEDPFFRLTLCERTGVCPSIAHAKSSKKEYTALGISARSNGMYSVYEHSEGFKKWSAFKGAEWIPSFDVVIEDGQHKRVVWMTSLYPPRRPEPAIGAGGVKSLAGREQGPAASLRMQNREIK